MGSAEAGKLGDTANPTGLGHPTTEGGVRNADEFVRDMTARRTRVVSIVLLGAVGFGFWTLTVPSHAPGWLRMLAGASLAVMSFALLAIVRLARDRESFSETKVGIAALIIAPLVVPLILYYGTASAFQATVIVVLFLYCSDAPLHFAAPAVALIAVPHVGLELAIWNGLMDDPAVFRTQADAPRLMHVLNTAFVYSLVLFLGQAFQRKTRSTAMALETAVIRVAAQQGLLREARQDFERAAGIGEPGRFSDQQMGSYVLGSILGRGGMGEIYEAEHLATRELAAVKVLTSRREDSPELIRRFQREAEIVSSLDSDHIVRVREISLVDAAVPYIAMERLEGSDLAKMLREREHLRPAEVSALLHQVGHGLEVASKAGVVHRDIKPQNLFLTDGNIWKILDFGIARLSGVAGTLTREGVMGTPAYMAPEQVRTGEVLDHHVDVHAITVVAYRALTGRPAFASDDLARILYAVVNQLPRRPSELMNVPSAVDQVLRIGLAKHPAKRFDSAVEMAQAFERALRGDIDESLRDRAAELNAKLDWGQTRGEPPEPADDSLSDD